MPSRPHRAVRRFLLWSLALMSAGCYRTVSVDPATTRECRHRTAAIDSVFRHPPPSPPARFAGGADSAGQDLRRRRLAGSVVTVAGGALQNATVRVEGGQWDAVTDSMGQFAISADTAGTYVLVTQRIGFASRRDTIAWPAA